MAVGVLLIVGCQTDQEIISSDAGEATQELSLRNDLCPEVDIDGCTGTYTNDLVTLTQDLDGNPITLPQYPGCTFVVRFTRILCIQNNVVVDSRLIIEDFGPAGSCPAFLADIAAADAMGSSSLHVFLRNISLQMSEFITLDVYDEYSIPVEDCENNGLSFELNFVTGSCGKFCVDTQPNGGGLTTGGVAGEPGGSNGSSLYDIIVTPIFCGQTCCINFVGMCQEGVDANGDPIIKIAVSPRDQNIEEDCLETQPNAECPPAKGETVLYTTNCESACQLD